MRIYTVCAMRLLLLAEMYTKRKELRAMLNSAPGIIKNTQRWSVSRHRRANLLLVLVNDKPPFNRRLCVRDFFFPPRLPLSLPSLPPRFSKQSGKVALPSSCGFFCAFFIWPEKECRVGVALYAAAAAAAAAAAEGRGSMRQQQESGEVRTRPSGGCGSLGG